MFDCYRPSGELRCPVDGHRLVDWQGKDGPRALFVWQQGEAHPVDQLVDEEVRLPASEWEPWTLPTTFTIYSYDCPVHQPIEALCATREGTWSSTEICSPGPPPGTRLR